MKRATRTHRRGFHRRLIALGLTSLALPMLACSSPSFAKAPKVVFPITAEEADKVMYDAMVDEFGVASIHRMSYPHPGYRYAETTIRRVETRGRTESGETLRGYAFQATGHRSEAVARNVAHLAAEFAPALPLVDG